MGIVDLSHPIGHGTVTYPGLPGPEIRDHLTREASRERYAPGYEFQIGRIEMVANTGTYLDTPFHRFPDGHDLTGLDRFPHSVEQRPQFGQPRSLDKVRGCDDTLSSVGVDVPHA